MQIFIRYFLAISIVTGILFVIFSDEHVQKQLSVVSRHVLKNVENIYPDRSCEEPLAYKLGTIDERFNISNDEILKLLSDSEKLWEDASEKDLFVLDQNNTEAIPVNFVFDERQQEIISARESEDLLDTQWASYENLKQQYEKLSSAYKKRVSVYDENIKEYEDLLDKLNKSIEDWNKNSGTKAEYKNIKDGEFFIKTVFTGLEKERISLNNDADGLKKMVDQINNIQSNLKQNTALHNRTFAHEETVNSGDFGFNEINIYQYQDISDLRITLAHEMGHAIGLDHVLDEKAIMFHLLEKQDVLNLKLSDADVEALNILCK